MKRIKKNWSTRVLENNKSLTKHVNSYPIGNKPYRVCRKVEGKTVTFGYFRSQYEAKAYASACFKGS